MEWQVGSSGREKMKITKTDYMIYFEPVSNDGRDIRLELIRLINNYDYISFQNLFDYFDLGTAVDRDKLIDILKELTK